MLIRESYREALDNFLQICRPAVSMESSPEEPSLKEKYKSDAGEINFYSFDDLSDNVKQQVKRIKTTPFIPRGIPVHGFVYHVESGSLKKIV